MSDVGDFAMIDWIPTAIVAALSAASLAVVLMAAVVGIAGFFGYRLIRKQAVAQAVAEAKQASDQHLQSDEFKELVRKEASRVSMKKFFSELQTQLDQAGKEAEDGADKG